MARIAEDIGLDSVWVGDHYLYRHPDGTRGPWEAWTQLAAIAAVTSRVEIGPLVASTSFHQPGVLAKLAMTVEEISGGRLILGLGAGWNETEYRAFGFPFDHRVSRFEEAFTIIRTLLREGAIDFEGRVLHVARLRAAAARSSTGGPPLLIGSSGPRMLRITMPYVDAVERVVHDVRQSARRASPSSARWSMRPVRDVGRDPTRGGAHGGRLRGATGGGRDFATSTATRLRRSRGAPEEIARPCGASRPRVSATSSSSSTRSPPRAWRRWRRCSRPSTGAETATMW